MTDITVLITDDQALVRMGLRALVAAEPGLTVVGEAADGDEAVAAARAHRPDVVLMDIRMPGTDGLTALRTIAADPDLAGTHVVMLTTFELDEYVFAALEAGASGFLVKDAEPHELVAGVRSVHAGEPVVSRSVTADLVAEVLRNPTRDTDPEIKATLLPRELQVLGAQLYGLG